MQWITNALPEKSVYGKFKGLLYPDEVKSGIITPFGNGVFNFEGPSFFYTGKADMIIKWLNEAPIPMEDHLTPEIIIEALRNSYAKETGYLSAIDPYGYYNWLENKIVDYRLLPDIEKSSDNWAKVDDKDKWLDEVRGNDIVGEGKVEEELLKKCKSALGVLSTMCGLEGLSQGKIVANEILKDIDKHLTSTPPVKVDEDDGWIYCPNCGRVKEPD